MLFGKNIDTKGTILYIGGFQLPDKNAAAQRVVGIAKGFRALGYKVVFLNSLKGFDNVEVVEKEYFGFQCLEYGREQESDYLFSAKTTLTMIKSVQPSAVIAYNYPAVALDRIRKYCLKKGIQCYADATEWYGASGSNLVARAIKVLDTSYRMRYVQKRLDGVIAISRFLYEYYKDSVKTVLIPPTVDLEDKKWNVPVEKNSNCVSFVYAGVPSATKERLDTIIVAIGAIEKVKRVRLNIVGITKEQFADLYSWEKPIPESVVFWGRVEHQKALTIVKQSDWAIILRENNRVVKAGFPTKLVESISCGTPVLANRFSNVFDYLTDENSICVEDMDNISMYLLQAYEKQCNVDNGKFDYRAYLTEIKELIK